MADPYTSAYGSVECTFKGNKMRFLNTAWALTRGESEPLGASAGRLRALAPLNGTLVKALHRFSRLNLAAPGGVLCTGRRPERKQGTPPPWLTPEERLLILAARVHLAPEDAAFMKVCLSEALDWTSVERRSEALGLQPLLFRHLARPEFRGSVPSGLMASLEQSYYRNSMKNVRLLGELRKILDALVSADIPVVPLKGSSLARTLYGDIGLRPMTDLDLLCRQEDLVRAGEAILALGFADLAMFVSPRHRKLRGLNRGSHPPPFFDPRKTKVEIHLHVFPGVDHRPEDMEAVWGEAIPATQHGLRCLALSVESQLLHLILHLEKHRVTGKIVLVWFCDIHEFVRQNRGRIDWGVFLERVKALGACEKAGTVLGILHTHWKTPVPPEVLEQLGGRREEAVIAAALRQQGERGEFDRRMLRVYEDRLRMLREIEGVRGRIQYLFREIVPTSEYLRHRYRVREGAPVWPWVFRYLVVKAARFSRGFVSSLRPSSGNDGEAPDGRG